MDRRDFLKCSLPMAAGMLGSGVHPVCDHWLAAGESPPGPAIVDTNVWLFDWPFRKLKYARTADLAARLGKHRIEQAWAGSYEALLHKNLDEANARLAQECRAAGDDLLVPIGSVNPAWPDWEEDLRRCHEVHRMTGIRLAPSYHHYTFDHPALPRLLEIAARRGMLVQIACEVEDSRVHHPSLRVAELPYGALAGVLNRIPQAHVQLLSWFSVVRGPVLQELVDKTSACFDISNVEGNGGLERLIRGNHWAPIGRVPADRLLFGSHAPLFPSQSAVLKLFESQLEAGQLAAIMHRNARRLAGNRAAGEQDDDKPAESSGSAALDPLEYGVPDRKALAALRIWDLHYHGFNASDPLDQHQAVLPYAQRMGIERLLALDVGGTRRDPLGISRSDAQQREFLERHSDRIVGLVRIDPSDPAQSIEKMKRWIAEGPCVGIKYAGFNRDGISCSHPNNIPIIRFAEQLQAIVYIHTWLKIGGDPHRPGGANNPGESTPMDVALLAERFRDFPLICGHSGGDWELGIRAIRPFPNVYLEFAGSDPHSGQVDLAVRWLGADRIVWGGHGPTRSYATELAKILDADLSDDQRHQILGGNLRRIAGPIFKKKGYRIDV